MYVCQIIMLYLLNLHSSVCQYISIKQRKIDEMPTAFLYKVKNKFERNMS